MCSHIAALLFTLEANTEIKRNTLCISLPCSWLPLTFQRILYADIDFEYKRKKEDGFKSKSSSSSGCYTKVLKTPNQEELNCFFSGLAAKGEPAILSITPGFSNLFAPLWMRGTIPKTLTDLYNPEYLELSYPTDYL